MEFLGTLLGLMLVMAFGAVIGKKAGKKNASPLAPEQKITERREETGIREEKTEPAEKNEGSAGHEEGREMAYNTAELIAEAFDRNGIHYRRTEFEEVTLLEAGYAIHEGPTVQFQFFARHENGHGVQIRVNGLLNKARQEKRGSILEACNSINKQMRFLKFYLDDDGDVLCDADLPDQTGEDCVGDSCTELFLRGIRILDDCYHYIPEAYYRDAEDEKKEKLLSTLNALKELRDHPVTIPADNAEHAE